jgi:hypothetical protein
MLCAQQAGFPREVSVADMCDEDLYGSTFVMGAFLSVALCTRCVLATACGQICACCIVSVQGVFVGCPVAGCPVVVSF